jgi:hypothetical protein
MLAAPSLEHITETLQDRPASLIGILFAPPYTNIAAERIVPRLGYLNERTGPAIHFFCAGYGGYGFADDTQDIVEMRYEDGTVIPWGFSQKLFARFVNQMQRETTWRYSGEVDLILVEPQFNFAGRAPKLDFSDVLIFDIEAMMRDGVVDHPSRLFERIIDYAHSRGFHSTTEGLSNRQGIRVGSEVLAEAIIDSLPKPLRNLWKRGVHYRIQNIGRAAV